MMRRDVRASNLLLALSPLLLLLGGCHLIDGPRGGRQDSWWFCDESGCYLCTEAGCEISNESCATSGCPSGFYCDSAAGVCRTKTTGCTSSSQCGHGLVCQSGSCVPATSPCQADADCGDGAYCSNGTCKASGRCSTDADCASSGQGFVCDARGTCVPAPQPTTCQSGSTCTDGLCLDGSCGTCSGDCGGAATCQFDNHCGDGRVCLDAQCTSSCTTTADCGSAQTCQSSVCVPAAAGSCTKSADCGTGNECLNSTCYSSCSGTCASTKDFCSAPILVGSASVSLCLPDPSARPQCKLSKDCTGEETCVNGICRTVCTSDTDCAACPAGPVCGKGGFCMTAIENAPECSSNAQCSGKVCLNGQCASL